MANKPYPSKDTHEPKKPLWLVSEHSSQVRNYTLELQSMNNEIERQLLLKTKVLGVSQ